MSAHGERFLMQHLSIAESLDVLAREGLDPAVVPSDDLRQVYIWAMDRYFRGGRSKAPSVASMLSEWGDALSDHEIDIEMEPEDSIEVVIDDLKGSFAFHEVVSFLKELADANAAAETHERVDVVHRYGSKLVQLGMGLESHEYRVDAREAFGTRIQAYEERVADHDLVYGMRFGLPQIDGFTRGIHPGELAVLAAGPKVGKSFFMALVALNEWKAGKNVTFFTLENSVEMTLDRLACFALRISPREWQAGTCPPDVVEAVREWTEEVRNESNPLHVIQPPLGQRSVEALVQQAQLNDSDSILIDQLSFLEVEDERQARYLQIRELTHRLKSLISTGRQRMPCLLAHQISREGVKSADKTGYLEMYHLAEGSEVERTADWVFGIHRSIHERASQLAKFQTLASRREDNKHFSMNWDIATSAISVKSEITNLDG